MFYVDSLISGSHAAVGGDATSAGPQVPVAFEFNLDDSGASQTKTVPFGVTITHAFAIKSGSTGGTSDAVVIKNGSDALISLSLSGSAAGGLVGGGPTASTYSTFAAGDSLVCSGTHGTDNAVRVSVYGLVK